MNQDVLEVYQLLPKPPARVTTKQVQEKLTSGKTVRTVQRMLNDLESVGLALKSHSGNTHYWSRPNQIQSLDHMMSTQQAFAIKTSEPYLDEIIPASLRPEFDRLFQQASKVLDKQKDKAPWQDKFELRPPEFPVTREKIDPIVRETILKAVLDEEAIQVKYQRPGRAPNWRIVFPYGVVLSKTSQYLVGAGLSTFDDDHAYLGDGKVTTDSIHAYAMHRITEVKSSSLSFMRVPDFNLKQFADSGITNWRINFQDIDVTLIAKDATARILANAELHNATVTPRGDGTTLFQFTTPFTYQFVRWCIAHGHQIQLLGPQVLLDEVGKLFQDPRLPFT
ncbi:WYL domain-containing protein [Maribrevibacterium harenarium]|uniref:WYL domain-containing protein n=1 Tax=Maribrevibacterium harenarium TaxID=2589817 RepID=A0A501WDW9_9GAMM|nr:WYL domain-containing protein [Maribrevibacterium harenarium]TPE46590.1 WYL domain-containing protein [Maribrevibacterium harenarium]